MRWFACTAALTLGLAAAPAIADDCRREMSEQTLDPRGWQALEVINRRGEVVVHPSADGRVHLTALKIVCGRESRRAELSRDTRVETRTDRGQFVVEVLYPTRTDIRIGFWDLFGDFQVPRVEVRLALDVPPNLPVSLRSTSGDLATEGLVAPQTLRSSSGDVRIRDARGALDVSTSSGNVDAEGIGPARITSSSGDIEVQGAHGPIDLHSTSGDMTVHGAQDSVVLVSSSGDLKVDRAPRGLSASTSSGGIEVGTASGTVHLTSSSGDLSVDLSPPFRAAELQSSTGDVTVHLSPGLGAALDLTSVSGTLSVSTPMELGRVSKHSINGAVGRGSSPLRVRTTSGDIEVAGGGR